ncbi:MAG: DMT family transporter [Alphaproteobacteria bacterium]|nr:DMT family transporter [Alphaproteobacteria bacterium]
MIRQSAPLAMLILALGMLFWSGNVVIGRGIHDLIPPVSLSFFRWSLATLVVLAFAGRRVWALRAVIAMNLRLLVALALLSVTTYTTLLYMALHATTAVNATIVNSAAPVLYAILAWMVLGQAVTARQIVGMVISMVGVAAIVARGDPGVLASFRLNLGDALVLFGGLTWAFYSVLLKRLPPQIDAIALVAAMFPLGWLLLLPLYAVELALGARFPWSWETATVVGYVGIFPSILATLAWNHGVAVLGPTRASMFLHLVLVFGVGLAVLVLGETLEPHHLVGAGLILAGITLTSARGARKATARG